MGLFLNQNHILSGHNWHDESSNSCQPFPHSSGPGAYRNFDEHHVPEYTRAFLLTQMSGNSCTSTGYCITLSEFCPTANKHSCSDYIRESFMGWKAKWKINNEISDRINFFIGVTKQSLQAIASSNTPSQSHPESSWEDKAQFKKHMNLCTQKAFLSRIHLCNLTSCPVHLIDCKRGGRKLLSQKLSGNANLVISGRQTKGKESSTWLSLSMG